MEEKNFGFYIGVSILLIVILANILALIFFFKTPAFTAEKIKIKKPLYEAQTLPSISKFGEILGDPRFKEMKSIEGLKAEPKGKPNPFLF